MKTRLSHALLRFSLCLLLALSCAAGAISPAFAAAGDLDITFDGDGMVSTDFTSQSTDYGNAIVLQPDGKIVVAGTSTGNFALVRYNVDGSLDTSFDMDGKVITSIDTNAQGNAVLIQLDGKIIVAGNVRASEIALARYNTDGSLDTGFDADGMLTTSLGPVSDLRVTAAALDANGKIVIAGYLDWEQTIEDIFIARFNSSGGLDTSFSGDGYLTANLGSFLDEAWALDIQPDGKILVAGQMVNATGYTDFFVSRYFQDGSVDNSFGQLGIVTTDISAGDYATDIAIQPDGKIVVAGRASFSFALARYTPDGNLDTSFDTDGKVITDFPGFSLGAGCSSLALQPDGKIIAIGTTETSNFFALARYNDNGSLDTTFGSNGSITTDLFGYSNRANAVAIQSDGMILVAGTAKVGGTSEDFSDFAVARYLASNNPASTLAFVSVLTSSGGLSITPQNILFPQTTLYGSDVTVNAADQTWQASDASGTGAGWHVTLSANDFSDGAGHTIPVSRFKVQMANSDITKVSGSDSLPTSQVTTATALSSTGINILTAAVDSGTGTYNFLPHFSLLLTSGAIAGDYSTTVVVTIVAGP